MDATTKPKTRAGTRAKKAAENVAEALAVVAESRQVRRAQARRAHKAATRPGPTPRLNSFAASSLKPGGPGAFERHAVTLSPPGAAVERTYHFTKGHRSRRVAV